MITPTAPTPVDEVARHYDEIDAFYRRLWGEHLHHGLWVSGREDHRQAVLELLDRVVREVGVRPGDRACDVGCGYGATARYLGNRLQCDVVGYTVSQSQYDYARRTTTPGDRCRFILGDWMRCAVPDASFDIVLAIESTEHFPERERLFERMFRKLAPGGRVAVCAWTAAEHPRPWQVTRLLVPICCEARLAGLGTEGEYRAWLHGSGFRSIRSFDLSRNVSRTWTLVAGMVLRELVRPRGWKYLADLANRNRGFARAVFRLPIAYRTGALRYMLFTARKPVVRSMRS